MIAQRFRPVGWVAGVAVAACALYMISLQVASERGRLEEVDRKISQTQREIRQLQTELGTRASLRQLERWNSEVLALSAPKAGQFLTGEASLATLDRSGLGDKPSAPPPVMVAVLTRQAKEVAAETSVIERLTSPAPAPKALTETDKAVQRAIAPRQAARTEERLQRVAMLDRSTLGDLSRVAASEKGRDKTRP